MGNDTIVISVSKEDLDATGRVILEAGRWCKIFYWESSPGTDRRMRAKWQDRGSNNVGRYKCSRCGRLCTFKSNFCMECGADMREGVQDATD